MSGPYRDISGPNCVVMERQAVLDSHAARGLNVEILQADHQNKADVGVNVARQWFDHGLDAILEVNNSAIAMAINGLTRENNKVVHLNSGAASADLTGPACSPNMVHWTTDTWACAQSTGGALARAGTKRWFFITADYAFGHSAQREATRVVQANGGQVVGSAVYPFPQTTNFSSFIVSAASARLDAGASATPAPT